MTFSLLLLAISVIGFCALVYGAYKCSKWVALAVEENDLMGMQLYMGVLIIIAIILFR